MFNCRSVASEASEGTTPNNETIQPTFFTTFLGAEFAQNLDARRQFCDFWLEIGANLQEIEF